MNNRDDFKETTKRTMAERVAWRCCFPGCGKITIGPRMGDGEEAKSLNLGEAAHIVAAAEDGPRFDPATTPEFRKSIRNGIWMCRAHARFIDTDYKEYSVETLKLWKKTAEDQAYKNLALQENYVFDDRSTLIAIGFDLLIYGIWDSVNHNEWCFHVKSYLRGDSNELRSYSDNFNIISTNEKFIAVESQGDARLLISPIAVRYNQDGSEIFTVRISDKELTAPPANFGSDFKLTDDGDLDIFGGDINLVSDVDAAIQSISTSAGMIYGEYFRDSTAGSFMSDLYHQFRHDINLLQKTLKLELIRLSLVPRISSDNILIPPPLNFIKEIVSVSIPSTELIKSRLDLHLKMILGDSSEWIGIVKVFIKT